MPYINTKPVIDILSHAMPMFNKAEVVEYVVKKVVGANSAAAAKKWEKEVFIYSFGSTVDRLKKLLESVPGSVNMHDIFFDEVPPNAKMALEPKGEGGAVEVIDGVEWGRRRARPSVARENKLRGEKESKGKLVEILAEIATVEHANGLKLDNLCRLMMKTNEKLDELCEAWKGKG